MGQIFAIIAIFCQGKFAGFVVALLLRFPQSDDMSDERSIDWLVSKAESLKHGQLKVLANSMGLTSSQLSKILSGERLVLAHEIEKAVAFFQDTPASLRTPQRMVPIVGLAGAGPDGSVLFATGDGNFGEVPAPEGASLSAEALEVKGDSMRGMAEDGWIIFYEDKEDPREDHMGEPCVCFLEDDRVLIKTPYPGRQPGLFDLESVNAPTMRDVPVRHFAFVTDIKPRRSAQKFLRRNPEHSIDDVDLSGRRVSRA